MAAPSSPALALRVLLAAALALVGAACSSGSSDDPNAQVPTCAEYCATIRDACTSALQQYSNDDDCLASCMAFPLGRLSDLQGDTVGCRLTYAKRAAMSATMAAAHCTHAGPGGDGVCGDNCGGYCDIAMMYCTAANNAKVYDTRDACLADCATRLTDMKLDTGDGPRTDMGNQVACLLYHAQMGAVAPVGHCLGDLAGDTCK